LDRNRVNHESIEDTSLATVHPALRAEDNQMTAYLDQESRHLMQKAFPKLPKRQREALTLRLKHNLKYDQIAIEMDTSVGSVKAHIFHAIKNITRHVKGGKL
jgi:RNA polymerase sigma-70 factor (ECF subfamily)